MGHQSSQFVLVLICFFHFTAASLLPIYNKELFDRYPFPLYSTFLQMFLSIIPSFLIAWGYLGFPRSISWAIPPKVVMPRLIIHSFLYGGMMLTGNLGMYVSDLDFAVLFRLSTIASSSICGFVFLGERISLSSAFSILLVVAGLYALASNFQWSTIRMATSIQLYVQISAVFTSSFASLMLKLSINTLDKTPRGHEPYTLLFWRFLFGCIPVLLASVIMEPNIIINIEEVHTIEYFMWTLVGILISGLYQILNVFMHDMTTLVTLTIISQMKFLPTLIISNIFYHQTKWMTQQIIGSILLVLGAFLYSLSRANCSKENSIESEKTVSESEL